MTLRTCPTTGTWTTHPDEHGRRFCGACDCSGMTDEHASVESAESVSAPE